MKINLHIVLMCLTALFAFSACTALPKQIKSAKPPIDLPHNYNSPFAPKRPTVLATVNVPEKQAGKESTGLDEKILGSLLEAKLSSTGRFDVYFKYNNKAIALAEELENLGVIEPLPRKKPVKIDLLLDLNFKVGKTVEHLKNRRAFIKYKVESIVVVKDLNGRLVGRQLSAVGEAFRQTLSPAVAPVKGETEAILEAIMNSMTILSLQLANKFPITAQIVGISPFGPNRMLLNKGVSQGLTPGQLVVIWTSGEGIDIPLAEAKVSPGENESSIKIIRWDVSIPGLKNFINKIKSPGWLKQEGNKLFATTVGLPSPPEWGEPKQSPPSKK